MKKYIMVMLLLVLMTCSGCVRVFLDNSGDSIIAARGMLVSKYTGPFPNNDDFIQFADNKEPLQSVEYRVGDYHSVEFDIMTWDDNFPGDGTWSIYPEMIYSGQEAETVTIEMPPGMEPYLSVAVEDGTLVIKADRAFLITPDQHPKIYISQPGLERILVKAALQIKNADIIAADRFQLDIDGSCDIQLPLAVRELEVCLSGAGEIQLSGTAEEASYELSGSGNIEAAELKSKDSNVIISGAGNFGVDAANTLTVDISGAGNVNYKGAPVVTSKISGAGNVKNQQEMNGFFSAIR